MPRLEEECEEQILRSSTTLSAGSSTTLFATSSAGSSATSSTTSINTISSLNQSTYNITQITSGVSKTNSKPIVDTANKAMTAATASPNQLSVPESSPDITADSHGAANTNPANSPDLLRISESLQSALRASSMPPLSTDESETNSDKIPLPVEKLRSRSHEQHDVQSDSSHQRGPLGNKKLYGRFS